MLEKNFIPNKQALELKELGFDEPCFGYFKPGVKNVLAGAGVTHSPFIDSLTNTNLNDCGYEKYFSAPLYQQVFSWFNLKHDINHFHIRNEYTISENGVIDYYEVENQVVEKLINILKLKKMRNKFDGKTLYIDGEIELENFRDLLVKNDLSELIGYDESYNNDKVVNTGFVHFDESFYLSKNDFNKDLLNFEDYSKLF